MKSLSLAASVYSFTMSSLHVGSRNEDADVVEHHDETDSQLDKAESKDSQDRFGSEVKLYHVGMRMKKA